MLLRKKVVDVFPNDILGVCPREIVVPPIEAQIVLTVTDMKRFLVAESCWRCGS